MWLIVGLGNPGKRYEFTRHNIGFLAVERFARSLNAPPIAKSEHKSLTSKFKLDQHEIILAQPQTFMNLSGESVVPLSQYYKIETENIVVIHDEVDLPYGKMKLQKARGHGGHNGVRSIHGLLGKDDYCRLRLGVGRPAHPQQSVADFVLEKFSETEIHSLPEFLDNCNTALELLLDHGFNRAASEVNARN